VKLWEIVAMHDLKLSQSTTQPNKLTYQKYGFTHVSTADDPCAWWKLAADRGLLQLNHASRGPPALHKKILIKELRKRLG
jgi:hypothetical protein